jgi:HEAT repeat protein/uncharacterized membrane protein
MPIKFRCPNAECGKALTVSDQAAGRPGKCPGCGGPLVVPQHEAASEDLPFDLELLPESKATPAPVSVPLAHDPDWAPVAAKGAGGPVVSFDVVGLAWRLFTSRMGTWVLAVFLFGLLQFCCQIALSIVMALIAPAEAATIGSPGLISLVMVSFVGLMIYSVLLGGILKMALKQVDGGEIGVGDVFTAWSAAPGILLAGVLTSLGVAFGFLLFIIPGVVFAGLTMFVGPAVVDGLGALEAIGRSVGALKRQWFSATVFSVVMVIIQWVGLFPLGIGLLFTMPLFVLAVTVQYRRSFAPGGMPRKVAVADPWAEAVGEPATVAGSRGVPAWAWGVLCVGGLLPVAMTAVLAALLIPAVQKAAEVAAERQQRGNVWVQTKGQGGFQGGFQPGPNSGVMAPPTAVRPSPAEQVRQALADIKAKGDKCRPAVKFLANQTADKGNRPAVVAALAPLLRDPVMDEDAAEALGKWAGPGDALTLANALDSRVPRVRWLLFDTLRRLKAEAAIPALIARMAVAEDRANASGVLEAIGPKAVPELSKLVASEDRQLRGQARGTLRGIAGNDRGLQVAVALATLKSPDVLERQYALGDLGRMPTIEASRDGVLAAIQPLLKDANASTRSDALKVVEAWGTAEQVTPALIEALNDPDRSVKLAAITALRKAPDPRLALPLARLIASKEAGVRQKAVEALIAMKPKDDEVEAEVIKALEGTDARSRVAACEVLQVIGTQASIPALKKAAAGTNKTLASAALGALTAIDPSAKPDAPPEMPKSKTAPRKKR